MPCSGAPRWGCGAGLGAPEEGWARRVRQQMALGVSGERPLEDAGANMPFEIPIRRLPQGERLTDSEIYNMLMYIIFNHVHIGVRCMMIKVSATKLRSHLFDYLDKAAEGETIIIQRNNQEVARLVPTQHINWRDNMRVKPELLTSPEELMQPLAEIWEDYA
jgi:prevent-host-death family protein